MKEAGPECVVNLGSTEKAGAEIPVAADPPDRYHISLEKLFRTILCATLIKYLVSIAEYQLLWRLLNMITFRGGRWIFGGGLGLSHFGHQIDR